MCGFRPDEATISRTEEGKTVRVAMLCYASGHATNDDNFGTMM